MHKPLNTVHEFRDEERLPTIDMHQRAKNSDSALLERFRHGDDDAATQLYFRYAERIHKVANAETSARLRSQLEPDDVVQSVFRTFFRRVSEGFFDVPPGDEIWNLFLVIALNKIRQSARFHSRKKRDLSSTVSLDSTHESQCCADSAPRAALELTIEAMMEGLGPRQKQMIEMRIQGHELREIAATTCRSTRSVERVLKQFRDRLSRQINDA